jgi:hypothetical protein
VSETFADQLSRVEQMASGDPTWDLSEKDCLALQAVLATISGPPKFWLIDPLLLERLKSYIENGTPVGDFLKAVVSGDLKEAMVRADDYNRVTLYHLVMWMYFECPSPLWGAAEKYSAWITTKQNEREERAAYDASFPNGEQR